MKNKKRHVKSRTKKVVECNTQPMYQLGDKVSHGGVDCYVGFVNNGICWLSPVLDDPHWQLYRGLAVFRMYPNGEVKECYRWG